jgi:hypothetical protein
MIIIIFKQIYLFDVDSIGFLNEYDRLCYQELEARLFKTYFEGSIGENTLFDICIYVKLYSFLSINLNKNFLLKTFL